MSNKSTNDKVYNLPCISDIRGNLSFIEENNAFNFKFNNGFIFTELLTSQDLHVFNQKNKICVLLKGEIIFLINGEKKIKLKSPNQSIHFEKYTIIEVENISKNTIGLFISN